MKWYPLYILPAYSRFLRAAEDPGLFYSATIHVTLPDIARGSRARASMLN